MASKSRNSHEIAMDEYKGNTAEHSEATCAPGVSLQDVAGRSQVWNPLLVFSCVVVGSGSALFGFDDRVVSPVAALPQFVNRYQGINEVTGTAVLTAGNQNIVFCVPLLGAIIGALIIPLVTNRFGRKWPLILAYLCSYGGIFLQTFAPNLGGFAAGRFMNSITLALAIGCSYLYLSEIVPAKYRGASVSTVNIFNVFAGVIATIIVNAVHTSPGKMAYMLPLGLQGFMPTVLIPLTVLCPESPYWLLMKGRPDEAARNLKKLRGYCDRYIDDELRLMKLTLDNQRAITTNSSPLDIFKRRNIQRTLIGGSLYSLSQASGIIMSTTYATVFLTALNVANPFSLTVASSCCSLAGTIFASLAVDRLGRRHLLLSGLAIIITMDFICGGLAFASRSTQVSTAIAALSFIFNFVWSASVQPLAVIMPTELPTLKLRSLTTSYALICSFITSVITTASTPEFVSADALNLGPKTYLVFGGIMVVTFIVYYFFLPETNGRTFAEIDEMYALELSPRAFRKFETSLAARQAPEIPAKIAAQD